MRYCGISGRSRVGETARVLWLVASFTLATASTSVSNGVATGGVVPPPWMLMPFARRGPVIEPNPLAAVRTAASEAAATLHTAAASAAAAATPTTAAVVGLGAVAVAGVAVPTFFSGWSSDCSKRGRMIPRSRDVFVAPVVTPRSAPKHDDGAIVPSLVVSTVLETAGLWSILAAAHAMSERLSLPIVSRIIWGDLPMIQWAALGLVIFGSSVVQSTVTTILQGVVTLVTGRKRSNRRNGSSLTSTKQVLRPTVVPSGSGDWYNGLEKPWFNPPAWLFPIMWLVVCKPTQVYALSRLLVLVPTPWWILGLYCLHLALGDAWNNVFFGLQRIRLGTRVIVGFGVALLVPIVLLLTGGDSVEAATAGRFLLPTLAWVSVATALNFEIQRLNPNK